MGYSSLRNGLVGIVVGGLLVGGSLASVAQARTLDTAYGDVEVNDAPERVVTLYEGALARLIHEADLKTKIADGILLRNQNVPARI